jgi:hypothetical protein
MCGGGGADMVKGVRGLSGGGAEWWWRGWVVVEGLSWSNLPWKGEGERRLWLLHTKR